MIWSKTILLTADLML